MNSSEDTGRLIWFDEFAPADNMAIDEMLLKSVETSRQPTLRFYGWAEPTLSLGYFQQLADRARHPPSRELSLVRRATGGGAIVHDCELTYSIVLPLPPGSIGSRSDLYHDVHGAMIRALADLGVSALRFAASGCDADGRSSSAACPFLCFQRRTEEDLIVSGYKVLGSAQRRSKSAILQHGSLLLRASPYAPELPGIADLTNRIGSAEQIAQAFASQIQSYFAASRLSIGRWDSTPLDRAERARAKEIARRRFAAASWTQRR